MSVEEDLVALLTASTSVTGVVSDRIRPLMATQNETYPYIVFERLNTDYPIHLQGGTKRQATRVAFDGYAKSYSVADSIANALEDRLHGKTGSINGTGYDSVIVEDRDAFPIPPTDASDEPIYVSTVTVKAWHAATVPSSL